MSAAIHPLFAQENELRATLKAQRDNPLYYDEENEKYPEFIAGVIEIENKIKALWESDEYLEAATPYEENGWM
jgi:hypothetical protein